MKNLSCRWGRRFVGLALIVGASACSGDSNGPIEVEPSFVIQPGQGALKIIKRVVNDNGGTATVTAFGVSSSAAALTFSAGTPSGTNTLAYASQIIMVTPGSYTLRENDIAGYTEGTWTCTGATPTNNTISAGAVTVPDAVLVTCTITNDDVAGTGSLRIVKRVVNNNGGTAAVAAFGVNTSAGALTFGAGVADGANTLAYSSQVITVAPGSYTLRENDIAGYTEGTWTCTGATPSNNTISAGAVTVPAGGAVVCTITNDDVAGSGSLRIIKRVVNDNGGTAAVAAFGVTTSAGALTFAAGVPDGANTLSYSSQIITVAAGSYTLRESDIAGYAEGTWTCTGATPSNNTISAGAVTVPAGVAVVCTITNDDLVVGTGGLKIIKRVVNDNGGTATVAAFGVNTSAAALTFGPGVPDGANTLAYLSQIIMVTPGSYTLRENDIAGYTEGTWTCTGATPTNNTISAGAVTVPAGGAVICTITNDDVAVGTGSLRIIKRVVNDNGGTAAVAAFGVNSSAGALTFAAGVPDGANTLAYASQVITVAPGSYTLRESDIAGYTEGTWTCTGATPSNNTISAGAVTVTAGVAVVCTITNDDVAANGSLKIIKRVVNDNGGTAAVAAFGVNTSAGALTFAAGVPDGANTLAYLSQILTVAPGSYTLRENDIAGYTEGTWTCTGATPSNNTISAGAVTVPSGGVVICTITNDDVAAGGSLKIIKRVVNDNGGTAAVAAFGVNTSAGALTFAAGVPDGANTLAYLSQILTVAPGSYTLRENDIAGYTEGTWTCTGATPSNNTISAGAVTVPSGGVVICTITNDDVGGTIIIKKIVSGQNNAFSFATTSGPATALPNPITFATVGGAGLSSYPGLSAGLYTVTELALAGYTLTDLGCTETGGTNTTVTTWVVGTGVATIRLDAGETVTCTYTNSGVQTTRTQGFWSTHRSVTTAAWFGGTVGGNTFPGVADKSLCDGAGAKDLDTIGKVLGGFWSNIPKTSTGGSRSDLDKARMQLAQQLLAAILNNAAFGSSPGGSISIADARAAFCGTDISAIKAAQAAMAAFNESGDSGDFTPGASANGKDAKDTANLAFWDALP